MQHLIINYLMMRHEGARIADEEVEQKGVRYFQQNNAALTASNITHNTMVMSLP
jgi:hypothetical protein